MKKKKKAKTSPEKQPLDKKKQDLVNKIRKDKKKKDEVIEKSCKKDERHREFWVKEKELGKPIQDAIVQESKCTTSVESSHAYIEQTALAKEVTPARMTLWHWLKSIFSRG